MFKGDSTVFGGSRDLTIDLLQDIFKQVFFFPDLIKSSGFPWVSFFNFEVSNV